MTQAKAPFGSWKSPITSDLIVSATINFHHVVVSGSDIYWIEWRPAENGRYCIVKRSSDGRIQDLTPPEFNVRSTAHEYGGAAFAVADDTIYFTNYSDQHIYAQKAGSAPQMLFSEKGMRYTDAVIDRKRNRFVCVREDHSSPEREAVNTVVSMPLDGKGPTHILASGNDFYSTPRVSPDGKQIVWLTWRHPNMPWDGCELYLSRLNDDGTIGETTKIAGAEEESIFQPEWSPDGTLYFVSDRSGWWNLYRRQDDLVEAVCPLEAEFGRPQWNFGYSTYAFESADRIVCSYTKDGSWNLGLLDTKTKKLEKIDCGYADIMWPRAIPGKAIFKGGSPTKAGSIVLVDLDTGKNEVLRCSTATTIDPAYVSIPESVEFPTENNLTAQAFFYRPTSKDFVGPDGQKPPLIVKIHGGPTGATSTTFNLETQYWTTRGFAVLDVNYGGSTGYGRRYRERINGQCGIIEMDDCVNGARFLVERGDVDGDRLVITGGSAGGYVVLCAMTFRNTFKCGASHYGIADPEALARDTHKFESRYMDRLIAPYPEGKSVYLERSPLQHVDKVSNPIIFFQGLEDKVVPPNQAEMMVEALRKKKIPVAYLPFPGEQHGFRKAETVKRALDGELYFYSKILQFEPADDIEPVEIENLAMTSGRNR